MSKLDEIKYETYNATPPQNEDGSYKSITNKTRQQIKDLFLELIGEDESHPAINPRWKAYRNELRAELRQKVEEL